jgi:hypothetical protein
MTTVADVRKLLLPGQGEELILEVANVFFGEGNWLLNRYLRPVLVLKFCFQSWCKDARE